MTVALMTEATANRGETEYLPSLGVQPGQVVKIRSDSGRIHTVAEPDDTLRPGVASTSHCLGSLPGTDDAAMCMETIADVMVRHPKICHEDSTVGDVRQLFADDHVHAVLIVSATRLLTVIDRADFDPEGTDSAPAARLGRLSGRVIAPTEPADTALQQMIAASRRRLAVVGPDGTLLGLLCLKRSGTGFCSDENVRQRQRERLQRAVSGG